MADTKITDLAALAVTPANGDLFVLVDVSDTSMSPDGTDKYILWSTIVAGIDVAGAITTHAGASDPHGDRAFATAAIATHAGASDPHGDRAFATAAIATHEADTTNVHGIADTSTLYRSGGTDVAVADGGTGASTAAAAATNLGLGTGDSVTHAAITARTHTAAATAATDKLLVGTMHASQSVNVIEIKTSGGSDRFILSSAGVFTIFNDFETTGGSMQMSAGGTLKWSGRGGLKTSANGKLQAVDNTLAAVSGELAAKVLTVPFAAPAQITGNQNNYAPTRAGKYRLSSDASRDITGLSISQADGDAVRIYNVGSNNIVLKHQDTNSTDVNRFLMTTGADITLAANEGALLDYDGTTQRWRTSKL